MPRRRRARNLEDGAGRRSRRRDDPEERMNAETFEIIVRGELSPMITDELEGFHVVSSRSGSTRLRGVVPDQARLVGVLDLLRGLNVEIEAVTHVPGP